MELGLKGPLSCVSTACASGNHALGDATEVIRRGQADVMLAGGAEASITRVGRRGLQRDEGPLDPQRRPGRGQPAVRRGPRRVRDGRGRGDPGAREPRARRGPRRRALLRGAGLRPHRRRAPPDRARPHRRGPRRRHHDGPRGRRQIAPERVDYVNAHATSTPVGDPNEVRALRLALGDEVAARTMVSSTKSMHGHCLGAAGGVEGALTALTIREGVVPPTINLDELDPRLRRRRPRGQHGPHRRRPGGRLDRLRLRRPQRDPGAGPPGGPVGAAARRFRGLRAVLNRASTRIYGPRRGLEGLSWVRGERIAIGSVPVGDAVRRLPEAGVTHVVNCRAQLQTRISQDLWAEREVLGPDHVVAAPMWDHGRPQPPAIWAPAARVRPPTALDAGSHRRGAHPLPAGAPAVGDGRLRGAAAARPRSRRGRAIWCCRAAPPPGSFPPTGRASRIGSPTSTTPCHNRQPVQAPDHRVGRPAAPPPARRSARPPPPPRRRAVLPALPEPLPGRGDAAQPARLPELRAPLRGGGARARRASSPTARPGRSCGRSCAPATRCSSSTSSPTRTASSGPRPRGTTRR